MPIILNSSFIDSPINAKYLKKNRIPILISMQETKYTFRREKDILLIFSALPMGGVILVASQSSNHNTTWL